MVELIDLGGYIEEGQPVYPGFPQTRVWTTAWHEEQAHSWLEGGAEETGTVKRKLKAQREGSTEKHANVRSMIVCEHGPTHIDALNHVDPTSDKSIDNIPLERFYTEAVGVDVSHVSPDEFIEVEDIQNSLDEHDLELQEGDAITLHTGHRERNYDVDDIEKRYKYLYEYTALNEDSAYWLAEQGVSNIGIDTPAIDHSSAMESKEYIAHDMCAEYEVLNMENMENLGAVVGERFTLAAIPLKIKDGTGSPIRPIAILDE